MIQRIGRGTSVETPNLDAVPKPYRAAVEDMFDTWGDVSARNTVLKRYVSVNLFFTSFAKQAHRSRKGGFTGCASVFSPIPVTA